eukprot:PITA_34215
MQKEYDALIKNDTWKLVDPPLGTKLIGCKWVYKNKYKVDGSLDRHKSRVQSSYYSNGTKLKLTSIKGKEFEDATKYRQLVGSLNYLTTTRLDISFAVGILSRFMKNPCGGHWSAAKRVLRYLKGTQEFGIKYTLVDDFSLIGYSDLDINGDKETGYQLQDML